MSLLLWVPLINDNLNNQGLKAVNITNNSATYSSSGGKIDSGCWSFSDGSKNGHGINIDLNFTDIGSNRSICAWVYPRGNHADYTGAIVSSGNWNSSRWSFGVERANGGFTGFDDGYSSYYSTSIPTNTWTHLCVTVANGVTKFYKNGEYLGEQSRGSGTLSSDASNTMIGRETYAGGYFGFNGSIQDVRIYNHCLTPEEVKHISQGLVAHYTLGSASVVPAITNHTVNDGAGGWNNSGNSIRNSNDTSHGSVIFGLPVYSITCTADGSLAIAFSSKDATNLRGKSITASCWIYLSGSINGSCPYLRSSKYDNLSGNYIAFMKYKNNDNPQTWPKNQWIRIEGQGTIASDETYVYFCDYTGINTEYRAYTGWLLEEYDIATPYILPGTSRSTGIVYDSSGYSRNLTITGSVSPADTVRYDKSLYLPNQNIDSNYLTSGSAWSPSFITTGSVSFWCKFNGVGSYGWLPFTGQDGSYYIMATSYGSGGFYHNNIGSPVAIYRDGVIVSAPSDNGNWHHYCITGVNMSSWSAFKVDEYGGGWNSNMCISDLRLYNTVLSADDVSDLYKLGASIS